MVESGPPRFDPNIASGDPARLREPLQERAEPGLLFRIVRGCRQQHANASHPLGLLRPRPERPRGSRAAEQSDELAALHSITSSARASSVGLFIQSPALIASALGWLVFVT